MCHKGIDPDYEWGFRLSLGYVFDCACYDVRVEYTYLHTHDKSNVTSPDDGGLWPTYGHPRYMGFGETRTATGIDTVNTFAQTPIFNGTNNGDLAHAHARVKFDYDAVDLQFGSRSCKGCNLWLRTYAGLHFANIDHRFDSHYDGTMFAVPPGPVAGGKEQLQQTAANGVFDTDVHSKMCTWGVGPLFGADVRYDIACGFGIGAHFAAAILAGETDGKMVEHDERVWPTQNGAPTSVDETLDVCHKSRSLLFPYFRTSLGINYLWCCGDCFNLVAEVGYEFSTYINVINHFRFNDSRATGSSACDSFNLDGLYISLRATI